MESVIKQLLGYLDHVAPGNLRGVYLTGSWVVGDRATPLCGTQLGCGPIAISIYSS
ncbi:hypothetical protein GCM10008112_34810 [Flexivirga endophytica]|nr:hypothetical protein GCM10008112_34810 [Flexivirga endophytica]